ncbi:aromatic amino acid DMT transporter YddG [Pseudoalteromonas luteoviolacea]|uniref:aromatic amino acid DMT transporter YddG n=1 Tax=Pseudoalteromonas luteoviolacea TaxID=43657 RepID=UPI001EED009F|nr:aromatic amino acid DMT transporter YddG [Pseudoalteromonas luteoviolacea]MCF6442504.1 aromatic amino acid DMT transporter YddG [Pseudoalteromonas luteoviolacea]
MLSRYKFTLFGVIAVLLWSAVLHFVRIVTEDFGPVGGAALVYTYSALFLVAFSGLPSIKKYPKRYVIIGGFLFVTYELCLSLSLGFANSREQSAQVLIVNYLWPLFTILGAVICKHSKASLQLLIPGSIIAFIGVCFVVSGGSNLFAGMSANIMSNPLAFVLAFSGAIIWAIYCNLTKTMSNGENAITLFFIFTACTLWLKWYLLDAGFSTGYSFKSVFMLVLAGGGMALGYGLWNKAIIGGNMILLAAISYFTPVFSGIFAAIILGVSLEQSFWLGVVAVTIGSLLCWQSTRYKNQQISQVQTVLDNTE